MPKRKQVLHLLAAAVAGTLMTAVAQVSTASAHGSVVDPASRNYGCWQRWGSDFQNPAMATQDPMCWQAWQANPNAMWNWNGLYREGLADNFPAGIPDGQLCSGGHAEGGRYNALDAIGAWRTQQIANSFRIKLYDQASHGANFIRVYVTRQGFNALTQPLGWGNLELVGQIGNTPASQWTPESAGGVSIQVPGPAAGRTGRHIIYTIWRASHSDQSYFLCSDVTFPGGPVDPTPTSTPSPTPTSTPSPTPTPTPSDPVGGCTATYQVVNAWQGGFQADVTVKAGSSAIRGWSVSWSFGAGQTISQIWSGSLVSPPPNVTVSNVDWNRNLAAGATASFGFLGSTNSTNPTPTLTCSATT